MISVLIKWLMKILEHYLVRSSFTFDFYSICCFFMPCPTHVHVVQCCNNVTSNCSCRMLSVTNESVEDLYIALNMTMSFIELVAGFLL